MMTLRHQTSCRCHWHSVSLKVPQLLAPQIAKTLGAVFSHSNDVYPPIFLLSGQADHGSPDCAKGLSTKFRLKARKHSLRATLCLLGPGPCLVAML